MKIRGAKDTIRWYDQNAGQYADTAERSSPSTLIDQFISRLPTSPKVLDAGCGSGRDSRTLSQKGADVVGIDISNGLLEEAKKRSSRIEYIHGDITAMEFPDASFDGVWSQASILHLESDDDVKNALGEFSRVLKPGGILYIYTKEQQGDEKTAIVSDSLSNHDRFFRYYSKEELRDLVSSAGFVDLDVISEPDPHGRAEVTWLRLFASKGELGQVN